MPAIVNNEQQQFYYLNMLAHWQSIYQYGRILSSSVHLARSLPHNWNHKWSWSWKEQSDGCNSWAVCQTFGSEPDTVPLSGKKSLLSNSTLKMLKNDSRNVVSRPVTPTLAHRGRVVPVSGSLTLQPCWALHAVSKVTVELAGGVEAKRSIGVIALEMTMLGTRKDVTCDRCQCRYGQKHRKCI